MHSGFGFVTLPPGFPKRAAMTKPEPLRLAYWRRGSTSVTVSGSLTSSPSDIELHISIRAGIRGAGDQEQESGDRAGCARRGANKGKTGGRGRGDATRRDVCSCGGHRVEKVCVVVVYYSRMSHCSGPTDRHRLRRRPHRACRRRRICHRPSSSHSRNIEPRPSSPLPPPPLSCDLGTAVSVERGPFYTADGERHARGAR